MLLCVLPFFFSFLFLLLYNIRNEEHCIAEYRVTVYLFPLSSSSNHLQVVYVYALCLSSSGSKLWKSFWWIVLPPDDDATGVVAIEWFVHTTWIGRWRWEGEEKCMKKLHVKSLDAFQINAFTDSPITLHFVDFVFYHLWITFMSFLAEGRLLTRICISGVMVCTVCGWLICCILVGL